ncbi:MAG: D-2-hydroxyacid dehydrogenase [Gammaproteobacteria bacterium]
MAGTDKGRYRVSRHWLPIVLLSGVLGTVCAQATDSTGTTSTDPAAATMIAELGLREAPTAVREIPGWQRPTRIVVRVESPAALMAFQRAAPGIEFIAATTEAEAVDAVAGAQAVVGFCTPELVAAGKQLKWIQLYNAGAGPCSSIPAIHERGIVVTNMQRISGPEIAEHALAMLLAFTRGLNAWLPVQHQAEWDRSVFQRQKMWELRGRTMLIVGLGGIGTQLGVRAHGLGMRVIGTRASAGAEKPEFIDYVGTPEELLKLAAQADVVVNCTPLVPSTTALFNARLFSAMKAGSYFINVGRGKSVVQDDLIAALKSGHLGGAGLDVTDPEPLPSNNPLWQLPNVIITPHVAATSDQLFTRVFLLAQENTRRYVAGEALLSVVDVTRGY